MEFRQTDPYHSRKRNSNENRLDIIGDAFSRLKQDFSDSKKYITQEQANENKSNHIIDHASPSISSGSLCILI